MRKAVELLEECHAAVRSGRGATDEMLARSIEVADLNAAFLDSANGFAGCITGLHEVLRRQGLLEGVWCIDPNERFGPGQWAEIDRVYQAYPHLNDDAFAVAVGWNERRNVSSKRYQRRRQRRFAEILRGDQ